eukprot:jgi/Chlat1/4163/Chrsp27S04265
MGKRKRVPGGSRATGGGASAAGPRRSKHSAAAKPSAVNPFERLHNRKKFDVLGRKLKGEQRNVGKARSDALEKRKRTLLQEFRQLGKSNAFVDRRFGEAEEGMSQEERALLRFQRERQAQLTRKSRFNLDEGEEEELTHLGTSLANVDDFKDDVGDRDTDDELANQLDADMVRDFHFGGGFKKTKKEVMEELIAKSKYFKAEKAREKEERSELLDKLDADFRTLTETRALTKRKEAHAPAPKVQADDFDKTAKELASELRAHATDRLKTPEELAQLEKERLEKLELKRQRRMRGDLGSSGESDSDDDDDRRSRKKQKARQEPSGDDLAENFALEEDTDYKEEEELPDEEDDDDEEDESDGEAATKEGESDQEEEADDEDEDQEVEDDESDDEEAEDEELQQAETQARIASAAAAAARTELPYTFPAPRSLAEFEALIFGRSDSLAIQKPLRMSALNALISHLVEMSSDTPLFAASVARQWLKQLYKTLKSKLRSGDESTSCWPSIRSLLLLRLFALIFPVTDLRHPVMTPACLFVGQCLVDCPIRSGLDVALGLFTANLALSMMAPAKRFCPELVLFLHGLLASSSTDAEHMQSLPLHTQLQFGEVRWLEMNGVHDCDKPSPLSFSELATCSATDQWFLSLDFRLSAFSVAVYTLQSLVEVYSKLPSFPEIFDPIASVLATYDNLSDSEARDHLIKSIADACEQCLQTRRPLTMRARRATPVKQFNPRFEEDFALGKDYDPDRERAEMKKLRKRVRKEAKGAARELRKDNFFLADEKAKQNAAHVAEREAKYREAMSFLQQQEGAFKSGQLGKGRKRRR